MRQLPTIDAAAEATATSGVRARHVCPFSGRRHSLEGAHCAAWSSLDSGRVRACDLIRRANLGSTRALVAAVEAKDRFTERHSMRVMEYGTAIASRMNLPAADVAIIARAAILHDVGKIGVPDAILTKPGPLLDSEYELVKQHPGIGVEILRHTSFLQAELPLIYHHHERYDGAGYPAGLAGEDIPVGARILNVVDALEAMLSLRSYKPRYSLRRACRELARQRGAQFDPDVTDAALDWLKDSSITNGRPVNR